MLDFTDFFLAVFALECGVGAEPEALGIFVPDDFPMDYNDEGHQNKAPGKKAFNEDQGGKHHCIVPIEDPAVDAAFIFHHQTLKRTPDDNADQIAYVKEQGDKQQALGIQYFVEIEEPDGCCHQKPGQENFQCADIALMNKMLFFFFGIRCFCRMKMNFMMLQTTHCNGICFRNELQDHSCHEDSPYNIKVEKSVVEFFCENQFHEAGTEKIYKDAGEKDPDPDG